MTHRDDGSAVERDHWVAIKLSPRSIIDLFGPYTEADAYANHGKWIGDYPISAVLRSDTREKAASAAGFYLPKPE